MGKTILEYDGQGNVIGKQDIRVDKSDRSAAYLSGLFVDPEYRNQGIGSRLMAAAENLARQSGLQTAKFEVESSNPAISLYEKRGYRVVETKNSRSGTYYVMEKYL